VLSDTLPRQLDSWLLPSSQQYRPVQEAKKLDPLLVPFRGEDLAAYPISTWVNRPRNQGQKCIEPVATGPNGPPE
jgi:putative SOS response-associated peptidase YedK